MFLGDFVYLLIGVNMGKIRIWGGVRGEVIVLGYKKVLVGVIYFGDVVFVGDGFFVEGEVVCVDEGFGGGVFVVGGVEGGYFC